MYSEEKAATRVYLPEEDHRVVIRPVSLVLGMLLPESDVKLWLSCHRDLQLCSCKQPQNLSKAVPAQVQVTLSAPNVSRGFTSPPCPRLRTSIILDLRHVESCLKVRSLRGRVPGHHSKGRLVTKTIMYFTPHKRTLIGTISDSPSAMAAACRIEPRRIPTITTGSARAAHQQARAMEETG